MLKRPEFENRGYNLYQKFNITNIFIHLVKYIAFQVCTSHVLGSTQSSELKKTKPLLTRS
jgi:hypothetical protein